MKIVKLFNDHGAESPNDWGTWKLYSFNRRHLSHKDVNSFFPEGQPGIGLRRKLATGTAFVLDYMEHGACAWYRNKGAGFDWDTARGAGILVWEGKVKDLPKSFDDRAKYADSFLETYTCWANGEIYGYTVEDVKTLDCGHTETKFIDSCSGFYGNDLDSISEQIRPLLNGDTEIEFMGDAKFLSDSLKLI